MQSENLIQTLIEQTKQIMNQVEKLKNEKQENLIWRENPSSWNILECIEHLNLYSDFYIVEIKNSILAGTAKSDSEFKPGFLGNYFSKSMLPKEKLNKMKTFKDKNPLNSNLDKTVFDRFLNDQLRLIDLLNDSRKVSLNKIKVKISITKLIKLKLGDTFQFFINHEIRHLKQIEKIQLQMKNG